MTAHQDFSKISFRSLTVEDGLSQSAVFTAEQDHTGYLWFGTADGLNRYDGYNFKHFRHDAADATSISGNFILTLLQGKGSILWVGTMGGGLNAYHPENQTFTRYLKEDGNGLSSNDVYALHDLGDKLCVGTANGLNIMQKDDGNFTYFPIEGVKDYIVNDFLITDTRFYICTDYGLHYLDSATNALVPLAVNDLEILLKRNVFSALYTHSGELWLGTDGGLFAFDGNGHLLDYLDRDSEKNQLITSLHQDSDGHIWIGSNGNGLDIYDIHDQKLQHIKHNPYDNMSVSDNDITFIFEDRSEVIWIGTYGNYVNKYDKYLNQFSLYQYQKGHEKGLNSRRVFSLYEDPDTQVWVGTDGGGLNMISREYQQGKFYENFQYYTSQNVKGLKSDRIWAIEPKGDGKLYLGTLGGGLTLFNPEDNTATAYTRAGNDQYIIGQDDIYALNTDLKTGLLWVGSDAGLSIFYPENERFTHFVPQPNELRSFSSNTVLTILHDSKGRHWVGTFGGGVALFDIDKGFYQHYKHDRNDSTTLSYNKVMCVVEDSKNRIWIGTFGGGLNLFDEETGSFTTYTHSDGLSNDVVYGILEDAKGYLWMSTNMGISRFDPSKETFKNYSYARNLQSAEFNQGAYFKGNSGRFYFGGIKGFNAFTPNAISPNNYVPELVVHAFNKPGERLASSSPQQGTSQLTLRYPENNVWFEFVAFNYVSSEENAYSYMCEGLQQNWQMANEQRMVAFTNIPEGEYVIRVRAANNDGLWNPEPATIKLVVTAPIYRKSWFLPIIFILILGVVISITVLVVSNIRAKTRQQLAETELRASNAEREGIQHKLVSLRAQMDPHFIFNSLNSIQHFIAQKNSKLARQYLSKFAALIRRILNNSREETISVDEEVESLKLYIDLEKLRFDNAFDYTIEVDDEMDPDEEEIPSMLIQPYVENAIIHGIKNRADQKGKLHIRLSLEEDMLRIEIEDNGVGRDKAMEIRAKKLVKYKSLGMSVTQSRLELWGKENQPAVQVKDLEDRDGNALGTKVIIHVKRSHLW